MTGNKRSLAVNVEQNGAFFRARVDDCRSETRDLFKGLTVKLARDPSGEEGVFLLAGAS